MEQIQRLKKTGQKIKGFTLVELIVVIAIIGILAAILLPKYFGFTDNAREAAVISEAKSIRSMAETFYANNDTWPTVSALTGFTVQTGAAAADYTNSPTFSGTLTGVTNLTLSNGTFTYTEGSHSATCDTNGNVTGS
jgi:type IV pilus assembly protein PilA